MLANARATSCVGVSPHLRYLRFFLMGLELWKHIVILFRSKAFFLRGLGVCPAPDTFGKERRSKTYVAQALNRQKHQTSHPKRPRFVQIHADTPLFSPTSENPAKQTGITKQTTIQTRNQKTAHKNPKKTPNNTQHKPYRNNPQKAAEQQKTDRTADISRRKKVCK